jgi:AcrR family transcriptional regulator
MGTLSCNQSHGSTTEDPAMHTRERILATALRLFNEADTSAISTNHIATALGISPGNLYYHFRNKEEIIRALFEQQFARWDEGYAFPDDRMANLDDLQQLVRATFVTAWEYRFMYRELIALLRRDSQLHQRWVEVRARLYWLPRALRPVCRRRGAARAGWTRPR